MKNKVTPELIQSSALQLRRMMRSMARESLAAGAIGISTGTAYLPAACATTEEIINVRVEWHEVKLHASQRPAIRRLCLCERLRKAFCSQSVPQSVVLRQRYHSHHWEVPARSLRGLHQK